MMHYPPQSEPATGLHTPQGAARAGVYIRESDAIVYAADLTKALRHYNGPATVAMKVSELIDLLEKVKQ